MFSAVISTAARQLVRVKGNEAKENKHRRQISVGFGSLLGSLPRNYFGFLYGYYLGGRVQYYSNVCWVMRVSTPPLTVATTVLRQLANSRVIIIYIEQINNGGFYLINSLRCRLALLLRRNGARSWRKKGQGLNSLNQPSPSVLMLFQGNNSSERPYSFVQPVRGNNVSPVRWAVFCHCLTVGQCFSLSVQVALTKNLWNNKYASNITQFNT